MFVYTAGCRKPSELTQCSSLWFLIAFIALFTFTGSSVLPAKEHNLHLKQKFPP